MRANILISAITVLLFSSCTKNNDFIKETLEEALPTIEITSLGLLSQVNPFNPTDVAQVTFGGSLTKTEPGVLDVAWYTNSGQLVDSIHFDNWTQAASAQTRNNSVTTEMIASTYPNTSSFSGNLNLQLRILPASSNYTLRVYVRTKDGTMSTMAVSGLIRIK
ncbi:hypothetical protein [Gynurincola endophyticus]|uniref:hypothetical protein n=1 Tax=Gynurincola endophyticus TaxID=2479004 RepID=UPI000F8D2D0F|nr:hypothetical protein [Gynurincola endophyticus]